MKVTIKYPGGHSSDYRYEHREELYCPNCGKQTVWDEMGAGDYYEGTTNICISCDHTFTMPSFGKADSREMQIIEQIKKAPTD